MKKLIVRVAAVLAIGLVILVALNWSLIIQIATFSPIILPRLGAAPADEAEARLQDIEYFERLLDYDRSFDEVERSQFEALIASRKGDASTMSLAQLLLLAAEATAFADNGHTYVGFGPVRRELNNVGLRYYIFEDGIYVVRALEEHQALIGGRVLEIDGQPIDAIMATLRIYSGSTEGWRDRQSLLLLESAEVLHAAGLAASPSGYTLTVANQVGDTLQVDLPAYLPEPGDARITTHSMRNLDAETLPDEGAGWVTALQDLPADQLPLYLQQPAQPYMWQPLEGNGGYVRLPELPLHGDQSMAAFFDANLKPLPDGSLRYLVVDLRANQGGDITLLVDIAKWLPEKLADDGHLYILVGSHTLSAGINAIALLKFYGGEQSVIVGAPIGESEQYWAERGLDFILPNSGFWIGYATGYNDWANGCEDHPYCFPVVLEHGVKAGSLAPQHVIEPTYADYAAGLDVVMEWVYEQELP